jgi:hypothetical protein
LEHPYNKDGYRYILAEPDPHAPFRQVSKQTIKCSSHDVHKINAYRADRVCLCACFITGQILTKFGMDIMPMEAFPNLYFLIFYNW